MIRMSRVVEVVAGAVYAALVLWCLVLPALDRLGWGPKSRAAHRQRLRRCMATPRLTPVARYLADPDMEVAEFEALLDRDCGLVKPRVADREIWLPSLDRGHEPFRIDSGIANATVFSSAARGIHFDPDACWRVYGNVCENGSTGDEQ